MHHHEWQRGVRQMGKGGVEGAWGALARGLTYHIVTEDLGIDSGASAVVVGREAETHAPRYVLGAAWSSIRS